MKIKNDLKEKWDLILSLISTKFNNGEKLDIESIIFLIGVQELGQPDLKFNKNQKIDLMHIAVCRLLEPFGYYKFDYVDEDGWPHYKIITKLPNLKAGEQSILMKEADALVDATSKNDAMERDFNCIISQPYVIEFIVF